MNTLIQAIRNSITHFVRDEEGAQIVEYALIIAVVSIALIIAVSTLTTGTAMTDWITRVTNCLTGAGCK